MRVKRILRVVSASNIVTELSELIVNAAVIFASLLSVADF